jgi:hypothetical protein
MSEVSAARLRIAERCLIGAASARSELLHDENWQDCMTKIYEMLKSETSRKSTKRKTNPNFKGPK